MHYVKGISNTNELNKLNTNYDAFVCGSDVIWNPNINRNFDAYYLTFADKYAFSYAASFGTSNLNEDYLLGLKQRTSKLREISVREASGVEIIKNYTGRSSVAVADPIFLLNENDWKRFADMHQQGDCIFCYFTILSDMTEEFVRKLSAQTKLKVVYAPYAPKQSVHYHKYPISPERWLGLLIKAKYVVTNSFHCTAFCTMFHKDFFTVVNGPKDDGINIRMYEFLEQTGLSERYYNEVPFVFNLEESDFTQADAEISMLRQLSMDFIIHNLETAYKEKKYSASSK